MDFIIFRKFKDKKNIILLSLVILILLITFFFDKGLSVGLILLLILSGITFFVLNKLGFKDKKIYLLFLIVLAIHLGATLFMHYANFQPFSGGKGDYLGYQKSAVEISQCFRQGDFSIKNIALKYPDLFTDHCYPVVVGAIYALTMPEEIIGLMLNVWLVAISIVFVYLIVLEIGGLEKNAFIIGLIAAVYPSYVFYTGLLLKDAIEIFFVILGLLFLIKIIKKFAWYNFLALYLTLICATHFRFYIGYALIITFVLSWFLFSKTDFKKRIIYGIIFIIFLGFIPQIAASQGYYGINSFKTYLNPEMVNFYRQVAYIPIPTTTPSTTTPSTTTPSTTTPSTTTPSTTIGLDSSFVAESTPFDYIKSFAYVLLGPFPWQIKNLRQSLALFETFSWYLLLFFIVDGVIICFKNRIKKAAPLLIFSIIAMVVIAIFGANFGIITRIRIPIFISLLCFASFGFNKNNIIYNYLNKIYEKILSYGRSRFYRLKHS